MKLHFATAFLSAFIVFCSFYSSVNTGKEQEHESFPRALASPPRGAQTPIESRKSQQNTRWAASSSASFCSLAVTALRPSTVIVTYFFFPSRPLPFADSPEELFGSPTSSHMLADNRTVSSTSSQRGGFALRPDEKPA